MVQPLSTPREAAGVALVAATVERAATLANLFQLYAHDFSEHVPLSLAPSGRFEVSPGEEWWTRDDHFAYLIEASGKLSGFALVRAGSRVTEATDVMDVAEFFVVRGARGQGVGRQAAHALFEAFSGPWEVRVRKTNAAARQFWSKVAESWLGRPASYTAFTAEGVDWELLRIDRVDVRQLSSTGHLQPQ